MKYFGADCTDVNDLVAKFKCVVLTHSLDHIKENLPWKEGLFDAVARSL